MLASHAPWKAGARALPVTREGQGEHAPPRPPRAALGGRRPGDTLWPRSGADCNADLCSGRFHDVTRGASMRTLTSTYLDAGLARGASPHASSLDRDGSRAPACRLRRNRASEHNAIPIPLDTP